MSADNLADLAKTWPWLGAVIVCIVLVSLFWKFVWPILRKLSKQADDFLGEEARPGVPRRPGLMERMEVQEKAQSDLAAQQAQLAKTAEEIRHEVFPNNGGSMRDDQTRLGNALAEVKESLVSIHRKLDNDNQRIEELTGAIVATDRRVTEVIGIVKGS